MPGILLKAAGAWVTGVQTDPVHTMSTPVSVWKYKVGRTSQRGILAASPDCMLFPVSKRSSISPVSAPVDALVQCEIGRSHMPVVVWVRAGMTGVPDGVPVITTGCRKAVAVPAVRFRRMTSRSIRFDPEAAGIAVLNGASHDHSLPLTTQAPAAITAFRPTLSRLGA